MSQSDEIKKIRNQRIDNIKLSINQIPKTEPNKSPESGEIYGKASFEVPMFSALDIQLLENEKRSLKLELAEKDRRIAELEKEVNDQCLLNGKGASREAALRAKVDILLSNIKYKDEMMGKMAGALEKIHSTNGLQYSDIFNICDKALAAYKAMKGEK